MANPRRFINASDVIALIQKVTKGQLISMSFKRVAPKCLNCGKSDKKWAKEGLTRCPHCGGELSFERETLAQFGVAHPSNTAITPKGIGESAQEAFKDNRIKFFDMNVLDENGNRGGYRQCRVENVHRMTIDHVDYYVL